MKSKCARIFAALLTFAVFLSAFALHASEPTAFQVIKEANKHVGDEVKDKVAQIRSEKSVGGLAPNVWYVVYYDVDAAMKATEVKLGGGKKLEVTRPCRIMKTALGYRALTHSR